jgi:putative NADPH-quinone reductase
MKVMAILAHPSKGSFNHAIADRPMFLRRKVMQLLPRP